jgi:hypothetical protein
MLCTTVGPQAQPLKPDIHRKTDRDLHCNFGQRNRLPVDVAAVHVVADLQEGEQHGAQDRSGVRHACGHIIGTPPQEMARMPEGRGGHAIAVEQPVEKWCGANLIADDPRLIADTQQHQDNQGCREVTQRGQRTLLGNPGDAGHHQGKADGEPAFIERESQGERERGDSACGKHGCRRRKAGLRRPPNQQLGRIAVECSKQQRQRGERDGAIELGDAQIQSADDCDWENHGCRAPNQHDVRIFRAALCGITRRAEQSGEPEAKRHVQFGAGRWAGNRAACHPGREYKLVESCRHGPLQDHAASAIRQPAAPTTRNRRATQ